MLKISACALLAAVVAIAATPPASAAAHHRAAAHRGHGRAVVADPRGLHAVARVPPDPPVGLYAPLLNGGGSEGYNAGLHNDE